MDGDTESKTISHRGAFMNCAAASTCINQSIHLDLSVLLKVSIFLTNL